MEIIPYTINCKLSTEERAEVLEVILLNFFGHVSSTIKNFKRTKTDINFELSMSKKVKESFDALLRFIVSNLEMPLLDQMFKENQKQYDSCNERIEKNGSDLHLILVNEIIKDIINNGFFSCEKFLKSDINNRTIGVTTSMDIFNFVRKNYFSTEKENIPIFSQSQRGTRIVPSMKYFSLREIKYMFYSMNGIQFYDFELFPTTLAEYIMSINFYDLIEYKEIHYFFDSIEN